MQEYRGGREGFIAAIRSKKSLIPHEQDQAPTDPQSKLSGGNNLLSP